MCTHVQEDGYQNLGEYWKCVGNLRLQCDSEMRELFTDLTIIIMLSGIGICNGTRLQSQHSGDWGRKIVMSLRSTWAASSRTEWTMVWTPVLRQTSKQIPTPTPAKIMLYTLHISNKIIQSMDCFVKEKHEDNKGWALPSQLLPWMLWIPLSLLVSFRKGEKRMKNLSIEKLSKFWEKNTLHRHLLGKINQTNKYFSMRSNQTSLFS